MGNPHDSIFRDTFGQPQHAAPLLRALLPPVLTATIDWDTLQPAAPTQVDEQQRNQQTDQLFTVRLGGRPAMLYVLFEHKAQPDRWTTLQVLAYMVGIWKQLRRRRPRPKVLPPILPVVVAFGRRRWRASTDLVSLLDLDGLAGATRATLLAAMPQFHITPHDFASKGPTEVRAMGLSLLGLWTVAAQQFVAPVGHDDEAAVRALVDWADVARLLLVAADGQEAIAALSSYILKVTKLGRRRLGIVFDQHIGAASMKKFESTYDRITRESKAEGAFEGRLATLQRLLTRRFGDLPTDVLGRLRAATVADLERWTDRVIDAASLDAVLAD